MCSQRIKSDLKYKALHDLQSAESLVIQGFDLSGWLLKQKAERNLGDGDVWLYLSIWVSPSGWFWLLVMEKCSKNETFPGVNHAIISLQNFKFTKSTVFSRGYCFVYGVVRLFWPADSWSAYRLYCRCQAAWIKQWCGVLRYDLSVPPDMTHRVNLNRFETGSGAACLVQAHAGRYSADFTLCCCWVCKPALNSLQPKSLLCSQLNTLHSWCVYITVIYNVDDFILLNCAIK